MVLARLRTEEEKSAIVAHCLELEQTGGDIIAYLWSQNYISPRATWCNFQREWLGRKPYEFTDGKPKTKKERENMSRLVFTEEQKMEAVRIAIEGGSPYMYLKGLGAKNPSCVWMHIKSKLAPEILAKIPKHPTGWKAPKADKVTPKQELKLEAGANYEVSVDEGRTEIKRANEKNRPLTFDGMEIAALRHQDLGEFYYDKKFNSIDWRTPEGDEVSMGPAWWKQLLKELPNIMKLLGVEM